MSDDKKKPDDIEPGELERYADIENDTSPAEEQVKYWRARYENIKTEYTGLVRQRDEVEGAKNEALMKQVMAALTSNYRHRKHVVRRLRLLGEKVEDKFVTT